jgi:hypothetical protein
MTIRKLEKLELANRRLRKSVDYLEDGIATLERKLRDSRRSLLPCRPPARAWSRKAMTTGLHSRVRWQR